MNSTLFYTLLDQWRVEVIHFVGRQMISKAMFRSLALQPLQSFELDYSVDTVRTLKQEAPAKKLNLATQPIGSQSNMDKQTFLVDYLVQHNTVFILLTWNER